MNEFDIIAKYFAPLTMGNVSLDNDAAVLNIPEGHELVVTSDTLNSGIHFLMDSHPADIAHKALRVNLSDLAAMGAQPLSYQLNVAFPEMPPQPWLQVFTAALLKDQEAFGIFCSGGDTTRIEGALSISITAMGTVPKGHGVLRSGALDGDAVVLTGAVGDAYLFLDNQSNEGFKEKYYRPQPRLDLIEAVRSYAHAALDISDGLVADLAHICRGSKLGAQLNLDDILFSEDAQRMLSVEYVTPQDLITGGDDYQLLLAVPPAHLKAFLKAAPGAAQIGSFVGGSPRINIVDKQGQAIDMEHTGWSHF